MIDNLTEAAICFIKAMGGGQGAVGVKIIRMEQGVKGPMCAVVADNFGHRAFVFLKRGWFQSYSKIYPQEEGKGFGQTVNLSILKRAAYEGAEIVVVQPEGSMYHYPAKAWLEYAESQDTIRVPSTEIGPEASVPSSFLKRVEEVV